jgi:purine-binding chemotaxis protein CheW
VIESWSEFYRRIEAAKAATARGSEQHVQDRDEILRLRAQKLARAEERRDTGARIEVVEFLLARERYAIASAHVREVYPLKNPTTLPGTPAFVLGIVNVRGQILSVLDLRELFGLPHQEVRDLDKVIIVRAGAMELGIVAEVVVGVRSLPLADLQPPLPTLTDRRAEYLLGVTCDRLAVLDAEKILLDERILVDEENEV